jgi:hypothetical protein
MNAHQVSAWLATELGGRITKTDLRTGALLRRTSKIVATRDALSWECYVNAASVWLWINGRGFDRVVAVSINRRSPGMGLTEPVDQPFARLTHPAFTGPGPGNAAEMCRRVEPLIEALALARFEYLTTTPDQITAWNRRPTIDTLRRRIRILRAALRDG